MMATKPVDYLIIPMDDYRIVGLVFSEQDVSIKN